MYATRYLLFGILILGWANFLLADNSNWQGWMDKGEGEADPPQTDASKPSDTSGSDTPGEEPETPAEGEPETPEEDGLDTSGLGTSCVLLVDPNSLASAIYFYAPEDETWTLCLYGDSLKASAPTDTVGRMEWDILGSGYHYVFKTIIIGGGIARIRYAEIQNLGCCVIEIIVPFDVTGDVDNPSADSLIQTVYGLRNSTDCLFFKGSYCFDFIKEWNNMYEKYTYYRSSCLDEDTGEILDCCITVLLSLNKNSNYMSSRQWGQVFNFITGPLAQPMDANDKIPIGILIPNTSMQQGEGTQLIPVSSEKPT